MAVQEEPAKKEEGNKKKEEEARAPNRCVFDKRWERGKRRKQR